MLNFLEKASASTVGFLSAAGTVLYCGLIALFFNFMAKSTAKPGFFGLFLMLLLFVFSAAVTGTMVFGFPAYLAVVKNKVKVALITLAFTLLYTLAIIIIAAFLIILFA